jgi:hypothetical protein
MQERREKRSIFQPGEANPFTGFVISTDEDMGDRNTKTALPYLREKPGGTDVGHVFAFRNQEAIAKIGINFSLLMQALEQYVNAYSKLQIALNSPDELKSDLNNFSTLPPAKKRKVAETIAKATEDTLKSSSKWATLLGYIVGNYLRLTEPEAPKNESKQDKIARETAKKEKETKLKTDITESFSEFLNSEEGIEMLDNIMQTRINRALSNDKTSVQQTLTVNEVYSLAEKLFQKKPDLRDMFAYCAFTDQMCAFGQQLNNIYMQSIIPGITIADHHLLVTRNRMGLYQISNIVPNAISLHEFLIEPFATEQKPGEDNEAWIARGCDTLVAKLKGKPIKGLCAGILFRHLMGESADLGMDNMLLIEREEHWELVNIDLTGPRLPRQNDFIIPRSTEVALGWENTLKAGDKNTLLQRLFDKSVFKPRGIEDYAALQKILGKDKATPEFIKARNEDIFNAIVKTLQAHVTNEIEPEISSARNWLAQVDDNKIIDQIAAQINTVFSNLHSHLTFDPSRINSYLAFLAPFISKPCEIARSLVVPSEELKVVSSL